MGLFGFKKANEEPKSSGTFINEDVINAADYSNMPKNTIIGYNQPTEENQNIESNYDNGETFVYSQVNVEDYNNQFVTNLGTSVPVEQTYYDQNYNVDSNSMSTQAGYNEFSSYDVPTNDSVTYNNEFSSADVDMSAYQENVSTSTDGVAYNQEFSSYDVPSTGEVTFNNEFSSADVDMNNVVQETANYEAQLPIVEAPAAKEFSVPDITNVDHEEVENTEVESEQEVLEETNVEASNEIEKLEIHEDIVFEEPIIVLDPLDNANNPVPVNPVAPKEEAKVEEIEEENPEDDIPLFDEEEEVKTNLFTVINMMVGVVIKPGSTISINARKYKKILDALLITFWVTMLSFVMSLAGRIVAGCFSKTENAITGASKIHLDFTGLVDTNNYVPYLVITLLIGVVLILVIALVYYIASFICSKGIPIGTYFAISTLSVVPIIIGFTLLHPLINIISTGAALMIVIFTIIYALIILFTGINRVLKFKNNDVRIIYNAVNMAIIVSVMIFIFNTLSRLNILDLVMFL